MTMLIENRAPITAEKSGFDLLNEGEKISRTVLDFEPSSLD